MDGPAPPRPRRRRATAVALGAAVALAVAAAVALALGSRGGDGPSLRATPFGPEAAPRITGRDQAGRAVALPREGRPLIVTFLYTHCPDVCPLIASEIAIALDRLGPDAGGIDVAAISVDPEGDTPASVAAFLRRHRLAGRMTYVAGTRATLAPQWKAWLVAGQEPGVPVSAHSARVALVDREGRQVGFYSAGIPVSVDDLTADMRALIAG